MGRNDSWLAMAAVRHLGCFKKAFCATGDAIFYIHAKFSKDILINGGDMPPKLNSKKRLPAA